MLFKEKRGLGKKAAIEHEFYYIIAQMFLIVMVALALFNFVDGVADSTLFEKNFLSKDIALAVNTIYAAPGYLSYVYPDNTMGFIMDFQLQPGKVFVYEELEVYEKLAYPKVNYPFLEDQNINFRYDIVSPELDMSMEYEGVQLKIDKYDKNMNVSKVVK